MIDGSTIDVIKDVSDLMKIFSSIPSGYILKNFKHLQSQCSEICNESDSDIFNKTKRECEVCIPPDMGNVECAITVSETDKKHDICIESDDIKLVLNESEDQMEDDCGNPSCSANSLKRSTSAASFSNESNYDDDVTNLVSSHQLPRISNRKMQFQLL